MVNSVQVKETISNRTGLIGSFYNSKIVQEKNIHACPVCSEVLVAGSKFCGECGSAAVTDKVTPAAVSHNFGNHNLSSEYLNTQRKQVAGMPAFAQVSTQLRKSIAPELKQEYCKVTCLLARERVFLILHYLLFLGGNLFGLWCALTAYNGLIADEVTRTVVALVPMFFINTVAFGAVVPIGGTKKQIARLKERMIHIHYQIEYTNLA